MDETSPGPQSGDFSVCLCCASILVYKDDMTFRIFKEQDMKDLDEELKEEIAKILLAVKSMQPIMKRRLKKRAEEN